MKNMKKKLLLLLSGILLLHQPSCIEATNTVGTEGEKESVEELVSGELTKIQKMEFQEKALCSGITTSLLADSKTIINSEKKSRKVQKVVQKKKKPIYTFLQGPQAWKNGLEWSGEWCKMEFSGRRFGAYGCGFCCMANIYSTLSPYEASPIGIFYRATQVTTYYPSSESGAISWENIRQTLESCGFEVALKNKPDTYEKFQRQMKKNLSMIALVSSANDATIWQNVSGHYVNIWDYDSKNEDIFLAEPGAPEKNRTRVPLRCIYQALKTSSDFQYLVVKQYREEKNTWKQNGIAENWKKSDKIKK